MMLHVVLLLLAIELVASRSAITETWPFPDMKNCGRPRYPPRTSNWPLSHERHGAATEPGNFPWHAQVLYDGKHVCGATILSKDWLITGAHCFDGEYSRFLFRVGAHTRTARNEAHTQVLNMTNAQKHGRYTGITMRYDLALIRLNQSIVFNDYVQPACLPPFDLHHGTCYASGWESPEGFSEIQHQVALQILPNYICNRKDYYDTMVSQRMLCAGPVDQDYSNPCIGDSGGPLVCEVGEGEFKVWELHGILSWSMNCSEAYKPAVFTRVAPFRSWITEQVRKHEAFQAVLAWMDPKDPFANKTQSAS